MEPTDEHIMQEYAAGRKEAVKVIFTRYKIRILNFCWRMLGNRGEAEDASCEVFLALLSAPYQAQPKAKFSTWLYTLARNHCVNTLRQKARYIHDEDIAQNVSDLSEAVSRDQLIAREQGDYVRAAVNQLPAEQREAIILQHYENMSYEDIAAILGCSLDKVKVLIFRAKERLRTELKFLLKEGQS